MKKNKIETIIRETCLVVGFLLFGFGVWLVYPPASFVVCGILLIWIGLPPRPKGGD